MITTEKRRHDPPVPRTPHTEKISPKISLEPKHEDRTKTDSPGSRSQHQVPAPSGPGLRR